MIENKKTLSDYIQNNSEQIQDLIDDIMDNFNFEKVHKTMTVLDWRWFDAVNGYAVPEEFEIKKHARRLLKSVTFNAEDKTEKHLKCATGGFEAECIIWDIDESDMNTSGWANDAAHQMTIELKFVVDSWGRI